MRIARLWDEWRHAFAAKRLRRSKIKILRQSQVANAKRSPHNPRGAYITQYPGFHPVCINRWVLQTAWYQYKQQYKDPDDGPEHKLFRRIAYRQVAQWCWGILGKEIRVVLPSCAVMCIRNFIPHLGQKKSLPLKGFIMRMTDLV